jgi:hypothetical protein
MIYIQSMGGLGNQMFIYAFARAISLELDEPVQCYGKAIPGRPDGDYALSHFAVNNEKVVYRDGDVMSCDASWLQIKKYKGVLMLVDKALQRNAKKTYAMLKAMQPVLNRFNMGIVGANYIPIKVKRTKKPFFIRGFFQSEAFFAKYKDVIRSELRVSDALSAENRAYMKQIADCNSVCVHVRRGDYTNAELRDMYLVCTVKYYQNAILAMQQKVENARFFVFSDDVAWTRKNIAFPPDTIFVDNMNSAWEDIWLMYSCRHFIISNSSFSWWAQYLGDAKDKVVMAPNQWNNGDGPFDIYMKNWNCLPVD